MNIHRINNQQQPSFSATLIKDDYLKIGDLPENVENDIKSATEHLAGLTEDTASYIVDWFPGDKPLEADSVYLKSLRTNNELKNLDIEPNKPGAIKEAILGLYNRFINPVKSG